MIRVITAAAVLLCISAGYGAFVQEILHTERKDFTAPFGAAVFFALLEILYLPALILNLSSVWITVPTALLAAAGMVLFFKEYRNMLEQLHGLYPWIVAASGILLTVLLMRYGGNTAASPDAFLAAAEANVHTASLSLGDFHMQGYAPFVSCMIALFGGKTVPALIALGLFANMTAANLILNILKSFELKNPWLRFVLFFGSIFYMNFYSWKITGAYSPDYWRVTFTALNMFTAYSWIKKKNEKTLYEMLFITMAGLFASNGFTLLALELLYALLVYFLRRQRVRTLYDIITLLGPVILYGCGWMGRWAPARAWTVALLYAALLFARNTKSGYRTVVSLENFLIDHAGKLFLIIVPAGFLIVSLALRLFEPGLAVPYSEYINFMTGTTVRPFMILHCSILDIALDIFRWGGMIWLLWRTKKEEDRMIRYLFLCTMIFFLNPLCMGLFTRITGPEIYANAFEILFNPFTDILFFVTIYYLFEWNVIGQWVLELSLCAVVLLGHAGSFLNRPYGLYTDLVRENAPVQEVLP